MKEKAIAALHLEAAKKSGLRDRRIEEIELRIKDLEAAILCERVWYLNQSKSDEEAVRAYVTFRSQEGRERALKAFR